MVIMGIQPKGDMGVKGKVRSGGFDPGGIQPGRNQILSGFLSQEPSVSVIRASLNESLFYGENKKVGRGWGEEMAC